MPMGSIYFVKELPAIDAEGGAVIFTITSGEQTSKFAFPMWLARIVNKHVAELIANHDKAKAA